MAGTRQFDEQAAMAAALDVFWRKGLDDATMQDLADAAGVQRGSLYNAYGGKEAIFLRAYDDYADRLLAAADKALSQGDLAARLAGFLDVIVANMTTGSPSRGCLTSRAAFAASGKAVRQRVRALLDRLEARLGEAIASAPDRPATAEPARLARLVVAFTRGLAVMERAGYNRKQLRELAATFVGTLSRGA